MAELTKKIIQFGIDKVYIAKLTKDDKSGVKYDTSLGLVRLEGVQNLKVTETSNEYTLQGDNGTVDIISITEGYEVEFSYGALTFEQLQMLKGGEIVEEVDGSSNVIKRRYVNKSNDKADFFGLIGVIENSNTKIILPKVKAISVEVPYSNLTHAVVSVKAKAMKRDFDGVMRIQDQELNLTPASLSDFDYTK